VPSREPDDGDIFTVLAGWWSAEPVDAEEPFQAGFVYFVLGSLGPVVQPGDRVRLIVQRDK
jgi:hypothetical protein